MAILCYFILAIALIDPLIGVIDGNGLYLVDHIGYWAQRPHSKYKSKIRLSPGLNTKPIIKTIFKFLILERPYLSQAETNMM